MSSGSLTYRIFAFYFYRRRRRRTTRVMSSVDMHHVRRRTDSFRASTGISVITERGAKRCNQIIISSLSPSNVGRNHMTSPRTDKHRLGLKFSLGRGRFEGVSRSSLERRGSLVPRDRNATPPAGMHSRDRK